MINTTLIKIEDVKMFYSRADICKYFFFQSTMTDTTHITLTITPTKLYTV